MIQESLINLGIFIGNHQFISFVTNSKTVCVWLFSQVSHLFVLQLASVTKIRVRNHFLLVFILFSSTFSANGFDYCFFLLFIRQVSTKQKKRSAHWKWQIDKRNKIAGECLFVSRIRFVWNMIRCCHRQHLIIFLLLLRWFASQFASNHRT